MTDDELTKEIRERNRNLARRMASRTVVFKKICRGLYISHEYGMSLSHEAVWHKSEGRKWELTWSESYMGLMVPSKRSKRFDSIKEARAYANALVGKVKS